MPVAERASELIEGAVRGMSSPVMAPFHAASEFPAPTDQSRSFPSVKMNVRSWRKLLIGLINADDPQCCLQQIVQHEL